MTWIKGLIAKLIGKNLQTTLDGELVKFGISKTKVIGWISAFLPLVGPISTALGHPVVVPPEVYKVLIGLGLYAAGDALHSTPPAPTPIN